MTITAAARISAVPPQSRPIVRMRWENLLFMHWPIRAAAVRALSPRIPDGLEIDTFDGTAWIGLIPFFMRFRVLGWPPIPTMRRFHECNVRTYVTHRGEPGVWFFSLDAASRLATWGARRFWRLPYHHARMSSSRAGNCVEYSSRRRTGPASHLRCSWRVGEAMPRSQPGELAHFLTERYALFSADAQGGLYRSRIEYFPWALRSAELLALDDSLLAACGWAADPSLSPLLHHADSLDVTAFALEPL